MKSRLRVPFLQYLARLALASSVLVYPITALAAPAATPGELAQTIADQVEQYLVEAVGQEFDGEAVISVIPPAGAQSLEGCQDIQVYMPPGRKIRSDTTVGARCARSDGSPVYVRAKVEVLGAYYVASQTIGANQAISAEMLEARSGDLLRIPAHSLTTPEQLVGRITSQRIMVGKPVRMSATRSPLAIQRGDTVKVEVRGPGLRVTNQGEAVTTADLGGTIEVRTSNGKMVRGVVGDSGTVFVTF